MSREPVPCLSRLLAKRRFPSRERDDGRELKKLQLRMLRVQQGIFHQKRRAIIVFEGFDAAGKGGAIRRLTEPLDPRGFRVHPIGPPAPEEQGRHFLYRFWKALPVPGTVAIFDRSWYGRVLVEKVEKLAPKERIRQAYDEIVEFERMLVDDGVDLVKVFLAIHPDEQVRRFEERLRDPYKQWKLGAADLEAHAKWDDYVDAADTMFRRTHWRRGPWILIPADSKPWTRRAALEQVTDRLWHHGRWIEKEAASARHLRELSAALAALERVRRRD